MAKYRVIISDEMTGDEYELRPTSWRTADGFLVLTEDHDMTATVYLVSPRPGIRVRIECDYRDADDDA